MKTWTRQTVENKCKNGQVEVVWEGSGWVEVRWTRTNKRETVTVK